MTYTIGTLLRDSKRMAVMDECGEAKIVSGEGVGYWWIPYWSYMTPVPCPPNCTESPTVPDWASDCPLGGMVLK